jgi:Electron transfer DM13/Bacterial Ig-like domain (group 2)
MKSKLVILSILALSIFNSCVDTDLVDDPIIGEKLSILPRIDSIPLGQESIFSVKYSNKYGDTETAKNTTWRSSDPTKISIDASGKARVLALGKVTIYLTNGTISDSLLLNKSSNSTPVINNSKDTTFFKSGVFKPVSSSYSAKGNVKLQTINGTTQIMTDATFAVSSGPSVYLLLTNHTDGRYTVTTGGQAINAVSVQITPNRLTNFSGVQTWDVPKGVNPADYKFAVLYCVLGPIFGAAELK